MKFTILYIDDEVNNLNVFKAAFRHDYTIMAAETPKEALHILRNTPVRLIISDYKMPHLNGIDFLKQTLDEFPDINRILLTAYNESEIVIKSVNESHIFSFVTKPWKKEELRSVINNALQNFDLKQKNVTLIENLTKTNEQLQKANSEIKKLKGHLEDENSYLKKEIEAEHDPSLIIGDSSPLKSVLLKIEQVAKVNTTVLINGETGTGKELVARYVHRLSHRSSKAFVKLNCAALPASLVESELFGYEKGAFTGAQQNKIGLFEIADGGTVFLDEIGEVPIEVQSKLLRILQDGEFYRIGGNKPLTVNVRIIAATNRLLEKEIEKGNFRSDLFYRLNVFPIRVPALRERTDDIPLLVKHFIAKYERKLGISIKTVPDKIFKTLLNHSWPGNIRELEAVIERSMILSGNNALDLTDWTSNGIIALPSADVLSLHELEKQHIIHILTKVNWKISGKNGAAEILKLNHNTLRSRMIKFGIRFR